MMMTACTRGSCTGSNICSFATGMGVCGAPAACAAANAQPDTCGYGGYCNATACAEIPAATCANFPAGSAPLTWNPATQMGPVIYSISKVTWAVDSNFCAGTSNKRGKVRVSAYDPGGMLLSDTSQPSLKLYRESDMMPVTIDMTSIQNYMSSNGGKNATFDVNVCVAPTNTTLSIALAYTNGNGACFTLN